MLLSNSLFTENSATYGGGAYANAVPISDCTCANNTATYGAGLALFGASTVSRSLFSGNSASNVGGGVYFEGGSAAFGAASTLTMSSCSFVMNSAANSAGGVYSYSGNSAFTNCEFIGNQATPQGGGAIYNYDDTTAKLTHCTLTGNSSDVGGGIFNRASTSQLTLINSILWDDAGGEVSGGTVTATYTVNQGNSLFGTGNSGNNPQFVDAATGDVRLLVGSPAIDKGDASAAPTTDILGNPRDSKPDLGAYEGGY
jgi:hypothetical protein